MAKQEERVVPASHRLPDHQQRQELRNNVKEKWAVAAELSCSWRPASKPSVPASPDTHLRSPRHLQVHRQVQAPHGHSPHL